MKRRINDIFVISTLIELPGEPWQNRLESFQALQTIRKDNIIHLSGLMLFGTIPKKKKFTDYFLKC